ncbi:hypothetical protein [Azospirillum rugosum]|uniref:Uncharacterized protein n=1 Tax=Azospirillum rugosum TaxID=416170 RepID=A0ABS4SGV9_9PROT|nr:hypothetical protein [Azospirillum rugosum]MBP2291801.1 hypothetical protein [Azospirillum rugosum]MDQ0524387.1 hypothetical protein [Azospirillum rugosum]
MELLAFFTSGDPSTPGVQSDQANGGAGRSPSASTVRSDADKTDTNPTDDARSRHLGDAYLGAPRAEVMMPGSAAPITMFDSILPADVRRSLDEHIRRVRIG